MSRRKGEFSSGQIDWDFPHQVMVLESTVAGTDNGEKLARALAA